MSAESNYGERAHLIDGDWFVPVADLQEALDALELLHANGHRILDSFGSYERAVDNAERVLKEHRRIRKLPDPTEVSWWVIRPWGNRRFLNRDEAEQILHRSGKNGYVLGLDHLGKVVEHPRHWWRDDRWGE